MSSSAALAQPRLRAGPRCACHQRGILVRAGRCPAADLSTDVLATVGNVRAAGISPAHAALAG